MHRRVWLNLGITVVLLLAATFSSLVLGGLIGGTANAQMLFLLAVLLIARFTDGYLWGRRGLHRVGAAGELYVHLSLLFLQSDHFGLPADIFDHAGGLPHRKRAHRPHQATGTDPPGCGAGEVARQPAARRIA